MQYTSYGKPNPSVFKNAENVLMQVVRSTIGHHNMEQNPFKTLYMIGDNPSVDIRGAKEVCLKVELNLIIFNYWRYSIYLRSQFTGGASLVFYLDEDWSFQGDEAYLISSRYGKLVLMNCFCLLKTKKCAFLLAGSWHCRRGSGLHFEKGVILTSFMASPQLALLDYTFGVGS